MKQEMTLLLLMLTALGTSWGTPPAGYTLEWEDQFDGLGWNPAWVYG